MSKTPFKESPNSEDELLAKYHFDYQRAKPNRFAAPSGITFEGRIAQANGRLKLANVGITIKLDGGSLYLRLRDLYMVWQNFQSRMALGLQHDCVLRA